MNKFTLLFSLLTTINFVVDAQKKYFEPTLAYTADLVYNFSGGDRRSLELMGLLDMGIMFNTDSAQWWKGGLFNIQLMSTHGRGISRNITHDLQGISAIEAGNHPVLLWELWYHQQFGKFGIRGGLQNMNDNFMNHPYIENFSGGSYNMFPTLSLNYSLANYPDAGLGILSSYQINKNWYLISSLFNGRVAYIDDDIVNIPFRLNIRDDGILSLTELKYISPATKRLSSVYGFGIAYHNKNLPAISNRNKNYRNNYTFYSFGEHDIYKTSTKKAGVFLQASYAPKDRNMAYAYSGVGFIMDGFFTSSHTDKAGIGLSQLYYQRVNSGNQVRNSLESTIETFIMFRTSRYVSIKPVFFTIFSSEKACITAGMLNLCVDIF